jgi:hypothetical protein
MEQDQFAVISFWVGVGFLVLFVLLNFGLERLWFPRPRRLPPGVPPLQPLVGPARRAHMALGTIESAVFIIGVFLIGMGCSILGTRGYGSF